MSKYSLLKHKVTGLRSVRINKTGEVVTESDNPSLYLELRKKALNNLNAANKDAAFRSFGLTKVKGAVSGKTYWE